MIEPRLQRLEDGVRLTIGVTALLGFLALRVLLLLEIVDEASYVTGAAVAFALFAAVAFAPRRRAAEHAREPARALRRVIRAGLRMPPRRRATRARSL